MTRAETGRRPRRRPSLLWIPVLLAVVGVAVVVALQLRVPARGVDRCAPPASAVAADGEAWVASWGAAMQASLPDGPSAQGFAGRTLRQPAHLSLGGRQVRVSLSNAFGDRPLVVGAATVARCDPEGGARTQGPQHPVTWDGRTAVTIAPGATRSSDPVDLAVADGTDVLVSTYLSQPAGAVTWRPYAWARTFAADGDATGSAGDGFEVLGSSLYFLTGVDVLAPSDGAVVTLGDSITEGCCSSAFVDAHVSYPDVLARRLAALPPGSRMAVVNAGISSNQVLTDLIGERMTGRVARDVLERPGVRTVVVLGGVNDLVRSGGTLPADRLTAGYREIVAQAHAAGVRVVGATVLPYGANPRHTEQAERTRQAVNEWIRTSGVFDAVADLDATTRDPLAPDRLLTEYDSGDGIHPSAAGYAAMAEAIRLADLAP
ncbi:GDSL-type esterase/lipase family protein [uncultured Phycicoccus sp.]|uniref:GDSL-type esterase/lipase family protein n=1 Tax=uncultured Phycicoccus sp. TaxID=661422 RepID=UPI0026030B1A|nr:GDSL-type esterase/lipase family protein [uncultured Phycicoccus sp.]